VTLEASAPVLVASVSEEPDDAIRVLLIEDGVTGRGFKLSKQGFAVRRVASLAGGPAAARDAAVIVLHCDGAKKSSIDLLVKLHRLGFNLPVVLLTGRALPSHECRVAVSAKGGPLSSHVKHCAPVKLTQRSGADAQIRRPPPGLDHATCPPWRAATPRLCASVPRSWF